MADPRLEQLAAESASRGWEVDWADTPSRVELLVVPTVSNVEQQGFLGFGVGVRDGGGALSCWAWEAWSGTLIEPWQDNPFQSGDEFLFPTVVTLEDCCRVFDRGALRYLAHMRRIVLEEPPTDLSDWADLEPLAQPEASHD
jgi:hypothetical protein